MVGNDVLEFVGEVVVFCYHGPKNASHILWEVWLDLLDSTQTLAVSEVDLACADGFFAIK